MGKVAIDFGTGNTVLARFNETLGHAETISIPGITTELRYRLKAGDPEQVVHLAPSLIHYAETETLIGDQVASRGLAEHPDTIRWMKREIAGGVTKRRKTSQGHKSPAEAGKDFLTLLINYASNLISFQEDEFTFTAPVEAFEDFQDWLRGVCEGLNIRRMRFMDEPTACVLGYHGAAGQQDRFLVFDFGCGTLDVSVVRIELASGADKKAVQLGQAGCDIGGMDIDQWLFDDFCVRHKLNAHEQGELKAMILRQAEAAKIALSDPQARDATINVFNDQSRPPRLLRTTYLRDCDHCHRGNPGNYPKTDQACLGCILVARGFFKQLRETVNRALENAAIKVGMRKGDLVKVLITGGTSLVPSVRRLIEEEFAGKSDHQSPFDAVARGACRGIVVPILQHDYAIEGYNREKKDYEFTPLFAIGTDYPTPENDHRKIAAKGSHDGQTRIGLKIFEVSRMRQRMLGEAMVDDKGVLRDNSRVASEFIYICLNSNTPTFIVADPPVNLQRDGNRFRCLFRVDGHRRLLVTVIDNLNNIGKMLLDSHPVVRL